MGYTWSRFLDMSTNLKRLNPVIFMCVGLSAMSTGVLGQSTQPQVVSKIWDGIGGKDNWTNARYFMFSCIGEDTLSALQSERAYLWDKQTGECRFEGLTIEDEELIVLFNIKTEITQGQVFVDRNRLNQAPEATEIITAVKEQFEKDASFIFLPTLLEGKASSINLEDEKLVGSKKYMIVHVKNPNTSFESAIEGQLFIDALSGRIQRWHPQDNSVSDKTYLVGGFKDIGGGLILPTQFTDSNGTNHISYPLAAALVNIEPQKFTQP